jgi:hypothetical protein
MNVPKFPSDQLALFSSKFITKFSLILFLELAMPPIAPPARGVLSPVNSFYGNGGGKFSEIYWIWKNR